MSDDELNSTEKARRKRLKALVLVACGVSVVALLGLTVTDWSYGARHGWRDFFSLVLGCSMAWQLMLAQKVDWKAASSPLSTLDLSQHIEGQIKPVRSEHWKGE